MTGATKIHPTHRERQAVVYLRQSSPKQVAHHKESAINQRALKDRLHELGWAAHRIAVIDDDQGQSGRTTAGREGFQRLVADVSLRKIGIVMGTEVSRLSRNCADWHRLLELCALFDTLIADADGIYHPRDFNDRILLGLKGTLSEAELHSLRQRLDAGRLSKARRGELVQHLPTGYIRDSEGVVAFDPDASVRDRIRLVFDRFLALGSAQKVLRDLVRHGFTLPRRQTSGRHAGSIIWKQPNSSALHSLLKNPAYAGAFVYGRRIVDLTRQTPGRPATGRIRQPVDNWIAVVKGAYPAYITWEQHEAIRQTLAENAQAMRDRLTRRQGLRGGRSLLTGLGRCGRCGHAMCVAYKDQRYQYICQAARNRLAQPACQFVSGEAIDAAVVDEFLAALTPSHIDVLERVTARQAGRYREVLDHLEQDVQRLHYAATRAERQYDRVDPENRLIAAALEKKWEAALAEWEQARTRLTDAKARSPHAVPIPPESRAAFADVGRHLPALWPQLTAESRKELLRTLVNAVNLTRGDDGLARVRIVWAGNLVTEVSVRVPVSSLRFSEREKSAVARIRELADAGHRDAAIAERLSAEGHIPCRGSAYSASIVLSLRQRYAIRIGLGRLQAGERHPGWTMNEVARRLGIHPSWLSRAIRRGRLIIAKNRLFGCYLFPRGRETIEKLRALRAATVRKVSFPEVHCNG
jgi:DNA invertase Pin-like site-specific DNA recombinase